MRDERNPLDLRGKAEVEARFPIVDKGNNYVRISRTYKRTDGEKKTINENIRAVKSL